MENTIIGIILGSTVITTTLNILFTYITNRKNSTLIHITSEREKWREKIRKISTDIEKTKFQGEDQKNINQYLVQLELSINPYGKNSPDDFEKNSHIWMEIDEIKQINNEEEFEKHKALLIFYLSLMLKEDWERSKREVKGYSRILVELVLILGVNCFIGGYYAYKSNNRYGSLMDTMVFIVVISLMGYGAIRYF